MALLALVHYPNPSLHERSRLIGAEEFGSQVIKQLVRSLETTMRHANGIGIAAPQVGENLQIALVDTRQGPIVVANPVILRRSLRKVSGEEGCLSVPGVFRPVRRHLVLSVRYADLDGVIHEDRVEGMLARVFQHEIDHLLGTLFIDRVKESTRARLSR